MKQQITEEMKIQNEWYKEAKKQAVETLPEFVRHLTEDYSHDYGTICHAVAAAGIAAMYAVDNSPTGGITGFQAGCIMWQVIREWNFQNNKTGLKILDYDNLLYPQYKASFVSISSKIWESVKKEAQNKINQNNDKVEKWKVAHDKWAIDMEKFKVDVVEWQKQHPEYPTYEDNPKFYEHLCFGTEKEWDEETKKQESGFMFAPTEPCNPSANPNVIAHWKSIVNGNVPFGLKIEEE
jgi:hypothetical protein